MRHIGPQLVWLFVALPAAGHAQPSRQQTEALLAGIDKAFNAADLDALLAHFRPTHKTLDAQLKARMKAVLARGTKLRRCSQIVWFQQRHGRAVALVRCRTSCGRNPNLWHAEHAYLVAGTTAAGPKAEVMVPVNDQALAAIEPGKQQFRCPACNYTFGGSSRWLAVPAQPDHTGCMESLTFIALDLDLVAEVSVHVFGETLPAKKALAELLENMKPLTWIRAAEHSPLQSWLPPAYAQGKAPTHLDGARCRAPLQDGDTADIHLATFGPIRYLMVVQGPKALLTSQRDTIQDLLRGFKLLDTKKSPKEICQQALQAHGGGGRITANTYENPVHNLKLTAPLGWKGTAYASRYLFRVRFRCQAGESHLVLQAMAPPAGFSTWNKDTANQLFHRCCADRQLRVTAESDWNRGRQDFRWREVKSSTSPTRILRVAVRGGVLVLMEGKARDQATLDEIRKAMATLALLRD